MIAAQVRKSLCYLLPKKSPSFLRESHVPLLHFFTTISAASPPPKTRKNSESIAMFFKESGFSDTQLDRVLKKLTLVGLEKSIKPKMNLFHEFGFSNSEIAELISKQPRILDYSASRRLRPSLYVLSNLLGSHDEVIKVLRRSDWFFSTDMRRNLFPNIEFLKNRGVDMKRIVLLLSMAPRTLLCASETIRELVEKVEKLGVASTSKTFIYCLWVGASMRNTVWESKLRTFKDLGFTESDILNTFRTMPLVFTVSPEKIKRIAKVILGTGKYTISSIKSYPMSLCRSLEKRIKPRLKVLEVLEKRKMIKKWPCLAVVYSYTDQRFHDSFIAPYPEVFPDGISSPSSGRKKKEKH